MVDFFSNFQLGALDEASVAPSPATLAADAAVARLAGGGFVVTYLVDRAVMVQRYDTSGAKAGAPVALTSGGSMVSNSQPSVTGLPGGGYAVSWVDSSTHVAVQVFNANGAATTGIFGVGAPTNYQQQPAITALANGDLAIAWTFNSSASSIRFQVVHANGEPVTGEIAATSSPYFNSFYPQVAALAGGGFVLGWSGNFDSEGGGTVRAQSYDSAGNAQGSLVRVANLVSYHDNFFEGIAALPSGGYVLTWTEAGDGNGTTSKVMAQLYGANGTAAGERFQVNTGTAYNAGQATVAVLDGGSFLVSWKSDVPGDGPNYFQTGDIEAQLFDAAGNRIGSEFQVNHASANGEDLPLVTGFGTGDVAIVWHGYTAIGQDALTARMLYSVTSGTGGPDTMTGTAGVDYLRGLDGDDTLYGGTDADVMVGGAGNDLYYVDNSRDVASELAGEGYDTIVNTGGAGLYVALPANVERMIGGSGAGNALDNVLVGSDGADTLDSHDAGHDLLFGGLGDDTYHLAGLDDTVFEDAGGGVDTVVSDTSYYLYANIENLTLLGGDGSFGVGNQLDNAITGSASANLLLGGGGNDMIRGAGGVDTLYGEDGNDLLFGDAGNDVLVGGLGNDAMDGGTGGDSLYGEDGDDTLTGGSDFVFDQLIGGAGNDVLHGDSGLGDFDYLYGNAGDDIFYVDSYADLAFEQPGEGTDTVYADINGTGYYLYADIENLVLLDDTPFGVGNELANRITGSATGNYLLGGAGDDVLNGKAGNDVLFGEAGADTFVFEHGTGGDTVGDFAAGTDRIDLSAFGFASFAQVQAAMSETGGSTAIILGGGDFVVLNGVANAALHAGDFILAAPNAASGPAPAAHAFSAELWHSAPVLGEMLA